MSATTAGILVVALFWGFAFPFIWWTCERDTARRRREMQEQHRKRAEAAQ